MSVAETHCGDPVRIRLIRATHARARELGLDEAARRELQRQATGHDSCADMTVGELRRVLAWMHRDKTREKPRSAASFDRLPSGPLGSKLRALWLSGWHLGVVRNYSDAPLMRLIRRQTGLDAAYFAHRPEDAAKAVEALKAWLARAAGVDWSPEFPGHLPNPRIRVLQAQWRILGELGLEADAGDPALQAYARNCFRLEPTICLKTLSPQQQDDLIRRLGGRIRQARTVAGGDAA